MSGYAPSFGVGTNSVGMNEDDFGIGYGVTPKLCLAPQPVPVGFAGCQGDPSDLRQHMLSNGRQVDRRSSTLPQAIPANMTGSQGIPHDMDQNGTTNGIDCNLSMASHQERSAAEDDELYQCQRFWDAAHRMASQARISMNRLEFLSKVMEYVNHTGNTDELAVVLDLVNGNPADAGPALEMSAVHVEDINPLFGGAVAAHLSSTPDPSEADFSQGLVSVRPELPVGRVGDVTADEVQDIAEGIKQCHRSRKCSYMGEEFRTAVLHSECMDDPSRTNLTASQTIALRASAHPELPQEPSLPKFMQLKESHSDLQQESQLSKSRVSRRGVSIGKSNGSRVGRSRASNDRSEDLLREFRLHIQRCGNPNVGAKASIQAPEDLLMESFGSPSKGYEAQVNDPVQDDLSTGEDDSVDDSVLRSYGSTGHYVGACKPCLFWYRGLCVKGERCQYCHIQHDSAVVRRIRPSKNTRNLLRQRTTQQEL